MDKWILGGMTAVWIIVFLVYLFLRKPVPEKTIFLTQALTTLALITIFTKNLLEHFSYLWLTGLCVFTIGSFYGLYKTYNKKFTRNHDKVV